MSDDKSDVKVRELNRIHKRLSRMNREIKKIPDKLEERIDDKVALHKAECEASDLVKVDDNGNSRKLKLIERVKNRPENIGIPTLIVLVIYTLIQLGLI